MSLFLTTALILSAAPAEVALLCTAPQEPWTELRFQPVGASSLAPVAARLEHVAGESVQGALLAGRRAVVAVAVVEPAQDLSFASHLFLLEEGAAPRDLADRVLLGARPQVTSAGRVFVARGRPGERRVDAITLDEVDLRTGAARTVLAFSGYAVFPIGEWKGALVAYRVTPEGGEFLFVHPDALGVTSLKKVAPYARDFALEPKAGALVFTQATAAGTWEVQSLALESGEVRTLFAGPTMALLPTVFPDGRVARSEGAGRGLSWLGSQGEGFDRVRAWAGELAVGLNEKPDGSSTPFAVEWKKNRPVPLRAPPGLRLDIAGVVQR